MNNDLDSLFDEEIPLVDNNEYIQVNKKYIQLFGHSIPLEIIPDDISEAVIIEKARRAIANNTDNILALLGLTAEDD